ncbi:magnesium transporter CorA family protein, partial [Paraclostridium bifermentans]
IYLADNYILVVSDKDHYIYNYVIKLIKENLVVDKTPVVALFKINYLIFKEVIVNGFETLEKLEDMILDMEDKMLEGVEDKHFHEISYIRSLTRDIVKNIRPLLYIGDRILKDNIRYLTYSNIKKHNLDNLQSIDFGIDKLYNFAISTRELADKLLDIYSSQVAEKTNNLITKLTLLTAISAPLTIITGIYGMNFEFMPELKWHYGYYLTLTIMLLIMFIGILIFKFKKFL